MRYDKAYENLASRAVRQGEIDLESFVAQMTEAGMSADVIEARLLDDLENGGPIFGKFWRSLGGAASMSTSAAMRQGQYVGTAAEQDQDIADYLAKNEDVRKAVDDGDPETLQSISESADDIQETWICTLIKTCNDCLPLHGKTMFHSQWEDRGLLPELMHDGWTSSCQCNLVPLGDNDTQEIKDELAAPLVRIRQKTETGLKVSRRTARSVAAYDIERAKKAVEEAQNTLEGRRTLRLLGQVQDDE